MAELLGVLSRRWRDKAPEGAELVIRSIQQGSVIIEFGVAAASAIVVAGGVNSLFEFAKNLEETFGRLKVWRPRTELPKEDYDLARALTALTQAGVTITLSAQVPTLGSAHARVTPTHLNRLAVELPLIEGPPPLQMIEDRPIYRNVVLWVVSDGQGVLAFVPAVHPRPLPFEGIELPKPAVSENEFGPMSLTSSMLATTSALVALSGSIMGKRGPSSDDVLRYGDAAGRGFRVDLEVKPGRTGPSGYIVLEVRHQVDTV